MALTNVFETAMHGKLSTDIILIYNLEEAYTNFINDAKEKGYIVPADAFNYLFQLDVTFHLDKDTNSINLIVRIPLMRQEKSLIMHKYVGTAIPINSQYGMILENYHDIIAYNDEEYVTLSSKELWKCQKLANVHFCRDIIGKLNFYFRISPLDGVYNKSADFVFFLTSVAPLSLEGPLERLEI